MVHTAYNAHCISDNAVDILINLGSVLALCSNYEPGSYNITSLNNIVNKSGINLFLSSEINVNGLKPEGIEYDPNLNNIILSSLNGGKISGVSASSYQIEYDEIFVYVNGSSQVIQLIYRKIDSCRLLPLWDYS